MERKRISIQSVGFIRQKESYSLSLTLPVWDKWKQFDANVHNYNENYDLWKES